MFVVVQAVVVWGAVPSLGYPMDNLFFYGYFMLFVLCGWRIARWWALILVAISGVLVWLEALVEGRLFNPLFAVIAALDMTFPGVFLIAAGIVGHKTWISRNRGQGRAAPLTSTA